MSLVFGMSPYLLFVFSACLDFSLRSFWFRTGVFLDVLSSTPSIAARIRSMSLLFIFVRKLVFFYRSLSRRLTAVYRLRRIRKVVSYPLLEAYLSDYEV